METKRRDFLKTTGALLASTSLPMLSMFPGKANAAITPNPKKLVVLLLQGGNDGMNTIIPTDAVNYPLYQALRPDIGIDKELTTHFGDAANGVPMSLHPAFDGLLEMHADKFAVFPATHSGPFSNTSHFYQYDFFGGGLYVGQQYTADGKGWIGRHLDKKYETPAEGITAYDFTGGQFKLTRGNSFVLGLSNPRNLNLGTTEANGFKIWDEIKGFTDPAGVNSQSKYAAEQTNLFE